MANGVAAEGSEAALLGFGQDSVTCTRGEERREARQHDTENAARRRNGQRRRRSARIASGARQRCQRGALGHGRSFGHGRRPEGVDAFMARARWQCRPGQPIWARRMAA
jgi:hypothetical protein